MENFEQFRKQAADKIRVLPKNVKRVVLEAVKKEDPEKFEKGKKLKEAKRGTFELAKTETLIDPENPNDVAAWVKTELENYVRGREGYMTGSHLREVCLEIAKYLARRLNIKIGKLDMSEIATYTREVTEDSHSSADELDVNGSLVLMDKKIFEFNSRNDGSGFNIDEWHDENLRSAIPELIEYLKSQSK